MRLTSKQRGYGGNWRHVSLALRRAHPWCEQCGSSTDLTVDHLDERDTPTAPRSTAHDRLRVLCRPCNSRRQAERNARDGVGGRRKKNANAQNKNARETGVLHGDAPQFFKTPHPPQPSSLGSPRIQSDVAGSGRVWPDLLG